MDHKESQITNIPHWPLVIASEIKEKMNIGEVTLINDFEANGYGVQLITDEDVHALNDQTPTKDGIKSVVGAGTGLGEAYLYPRAGTEYYTVVASEGGHTEFPAQTDEDLDLRKFLS